MNTKPITGIVLAGGKSRRMGTDKSMLLLDGIPMIQHAVNMLKTVCSKVVISSNNFIYDFTGCETWPDELPDGAPMIGIYSCLKRSETEMNLVLSCDMPFVNTGLLNYLIEKSSGFDISVPIHDADFTEPLCGVYNRPAIATLQEFIENQIYRLNDCIRASAHQFIPIGEELSFYSHRLFSNINTPEDFRSI
jgi:molybdopterin-guanine dinucleotide biosynthesis protein A